METIKSDKYEYHCYYYVDEEVEGSDRINKTLDIIRDFLKEVEERTQVKDILSRVVAYDCREINGFSIKQGGEYIIAISLGTFHELYKWFLTWFSCEKTYESLSLDKSKKAEYIQKAYEYSIRFLIAHEFYHVGNGHCDLPENEEQFIFERSSEIERENALFKQALEYDADCCAMACCVNHILYKEIIKKVTRDVLKEELQIQLFAIYSVFKMFSQYEEYDFDNFIDDDLFKYDHPNAGLRFVATEYVMGTIINGIFEEKDATELCGNPVINIISFEKQVLCVNDIKETLFGIAFTKKGDNHIVRMHNAWEGVRKRLEAYAYNDLARFEPVQGGNAFIDEEGKAIKCIKEPLK